MQSDRGIDYGDRRAAKCDHLASWLAARGRPVTHREVVESGDVGAALLKAAADCDLIVAGAFGHSRLREFVFGGVTRRLMQSTDGPSLLLAH